MRSINFSSRRFSIPKRSRGQGTIELLSVIPLMFLIIGLIISAGWWTYSRMNAISHTYFITTEIMSYNNPSRLETHDASYESVTSGRPFWFDLRYIGSQNAFDIVFGVSAETRVRVIFWLQGSIATVDPDTIDPNAYPFWDNPIVKENGDPKSTLPGSFCWYCSSKAP